MINKDKYIIESIIQHLYEHINDILKSYVRGDIILDYNSKDYHIEIKYCEIYIKIKFKVNDIIYKKIFWFFQYNFYKFIKLKIKHKHKEKDKINNNIILFIDNNNFVSKKLQIFNKIKTII
jgi:hypothetical protein